MNTSASKKCNQITQVCYFRPPVAQSPCQWKKDAAITVISQISCILRAILGVDIKNQELSRKISKAGNRNRLYIGKDSYLGYFRLFTRYKNGNKRHANFSEITDLNTYDLPVKDVHL